MKGKRIKKWLYYSTTFIIFISLVYFCSNFMLNKYYLEQYNAVNENISPVEVVHVSTNNADLVISNSNDELSNDEITNETNTNKSKTLDDYKKEYNNPDIVGRISILNTDFSMLLVQTTDNSYYLNHLVNKETNKLGATFVDYRVDLNNSKKINIYGHNNGKNSISFNRLMNYLDENYYDNYKLIQIETETSVDVYEIFAVEIVSNNNHMQISFTNVEWYLYLRDIIDNSLYDTKTEINDIDQMVTLQTCTNNKDNEFLLIHGRKIEN